MSRRTLLPGWLLAVSGLAACASARSESSAPAAPLSSTPPAVVSAEPVAHHDESPVVTSSSAPTSPVVTPPPVAPERTKAEQARAVFEQKCASCHAPGTNAKAGKHLLFADGTLTGHHAGSIAKTMDRVLGGTGKATMPPGGPPLPDDERRLLVAWATEQDQAAPKEKKTHRH